MTSHIREAIRSLESEVQRIQEAIAMLRSIEQPGLPLRARRGRKSMGAEERKQVSERMRRHWARLRKERGAA